MTKKKTDESALAVSGSSQERLVNQLDQTKAIARNIAQEFHRSINSLTNDELEMLMRAETVLTTTNCWWVSYDLRNQMAEVAGDILAARKAG